MNQKTRFMAPLLLIVSLGLCGYSLKLLFWEPKKTEDLRLPLKSLWEDDIERLKQDRGFSKVWNSIRKVEIKPGDEIAKIYIPQAVPKIPKNPEGKYLLEIMLLGWKDQQDSGAIVLYHFIDIETGNLMWELGRTFRLPAIHNQPADGTQPNQRLTKSEDLTTHTKSKPNRKTGEPQSQPKLKTKPSEL